MIIPDFTTRFRQDFCDINAYRQGTLDPNPESAKIKVHFAAYRMLAVLGMAFSAVIALSAVTVRPLFGVLLAATGAAFGLLCRDFFVIYANGTAQLNGPKLHMIAVSNILIKGTVLPIWDNIIP